MSELNAMTTTLTRPSYLARARQPVHLSKIVDDLNRRASRLAASRILSETADDLRSPLNSVREAIRMVANGELGSVNDSQIQSLVDAIDTCDSMERLIGDMTQLERLHAGRARAVRTWFDLQPVCHRVAASLETVLRPRKITIAWDGIEVSTPKVFGDADKLARLLANLITHAARQTADYQSILVRATKVHDGETLRFVIIDSGQGLTVDAWNRISKRGTSHRGADEFGLTICRQLASVHHSPLTILSKIGKGTEISFDLPIGSAASVAAHWTMWRSQQHARTSPRRRAETPDSLDRVDEDETVTGVNHFRAFTENDTRLLLLNHDGPPPQNSDTAFVLTVEAGATVSTASVKIFNERLQHDQRAFDFVYRVSERRWVAIWDTTLREIPDRIETLAAETPDLGDAKLRLSWSTPRKLNLASHSAAVVLADMLTREMLQQREPLVVVDDHMALDGNCMLGPSPVPAERLLAELTHLAARLIRQSELFSRQAKAAKLATAQLTNG
jgi:nitrogen-specific signal transduction histidine kinase